VVDAGVVGEVVLQVSSSVVGHVASVLLQLKRVPLGHLGG
jgi:hypothetical protein